MELACHGQKLKCRRNPLAPGDSEDCIRCMRAKAVCLYSPARPRNTSRYRALPVASQVDDTDNDHEPEDVLYFSAGLGWQSIVKPPVASDSGPNTGLDHPRETAGGSLPDHYGSEIAAYLDPMLNPSLNVVSRQDWLNPAVSFPAAYGASSSASAVTSPLPTVRGGDIPQTAGVSQSSSERSATTSSSFLSALLAVQNLQKPDAQSDASPGGPRDLPALVSQLSDLNSRLHRHMLSVPPYTSWKSGTLVLSASSNPESLSDSEFALDQTFSLSQELAELLSQIFPTTTSPGAEDTLSQELDSPSELLILTSYLYLVEIYDKILRHMHICAQAHKRVGAAEAAARQPLRLPDLSVGSFAISSSSTSTGVVILLLMQAMLGPVRIAIDEMTQQAQGQMSEAGENDSSGRITRTTREAIREKEQSMLDRFATVTQLALQPVSS
ncbi:hypothetical protein F5X97DRAFT_157364 [Nemania serpens]|nr:hypothetical protein F5X97DRAFT_157364 [Nemania serpens]